MAGEDVERQLRALQDVLQESAWFERWSLQEALYEWSATGMPAAEVREWLAADVARAGDARVFREVGIGAEEVRAAELGEQVSMGTLAVDEAARQLVGAAELSRRVQYAVGLASVGDRVEANNGSLWWRGRLQRVASLAEAIPPDVRAPMRTEVRKVPDVGLIAMREGAAAWGGEVTIAVARQELGRLGNLRVARLAALPTLGASAPLVDLMLGSLASEELHHRLGQRVEAAIATPASYLLAMLGPYPASTAAQLTWTQMAVDVEGFRLDYRITDMQEALGPADREMRLDQRERFHALNRSLVQVRIDLGRAESRRVDGAPGRDERSSVAADDATDPDGLGAITASGLEVPTAGPRPDERLTEHLRSLARHVPEATRAVATSLPDADLAARWQAAMGYSPTHDLGPSIKAGFQTQVGVGPDGGSWRLDRPGPDPGPDAAIWSAPAPLLEAAAVVEELDRRVEASMEVAITDPPAYLLRALGSWPHHPGYSALWEVMAGEIERYRLLTATTDPTSPLGQPDSPGNTWRHCWRRALAQDLAQCASTWMRYRHSVFGSEGDRADVLRVTASASDPYVRVHAPAALLAEHERLSTAALRDLVLDAAGLLFEQPPNWSGELATTTSRYAELERCAQEQRELLAAARTRLSQRGVAITPRARAARAAINASIGEREQAVTRLEQRLADTAREVALLQQAQEGYRAWHDEAAPLLAQGQAAAQVLQGREERLLDELAAAPPAYLLAELGNPPVNPEGHAAWRDGARAVERFRATYRIYDLDRTFAGDVPAVVITGRRQEARERMAKAWDRARQEVDAARSAITDSLAHELDRGLAPPDPGGGPSGPIEP